MPGLLPFRGGLFYCTDRPQIIYPFIQLWPFAWLPHFSNCESCCSAHGVQLPLRDPAFHHSERVPRGRIAGSYGSAPFNCSENYCAVLHGGCSGSHPSSNTSPVQFPCFLTDIYFLFLKSHPNGCEVAFHCGFICISLVMLSIFSYAYWPFVHLFSMRCTEKRLGYLEFNRPGASDASNSDSFTV